MHCQSLSNFGKLNDFSMTGLVWLCEVELVSEEKKILNFHTAVFVECCSSPPLSHHVFNETIDGKIGDRSFPNCQQCKENQIATLGLEKKPSNIPAILDNFFCQVKLKFWAKVARLKTSSPEPM